MEIERKFKIRSLPENLSSFPHREFEQAYLCVAPVVRVRKEDDEYVLTYKSGGMIARQEYNLPLTRDAYLHLLAKHDGSVITKTRYLIPEKDGLTIELDVFHGEYEGLMIAEVEFSSIEQAQTYAAPDWFGPDVSLDGRYHNSALSRGVDLAEIL